MAKLAPEKWLRKVRSFIESEPERWAVVRVRGDGIDLEGNAALEALERTPPEAGSYRLVSADDADMVEIECVVRHDGLRSHVGSLGPRDDMLARGQASLNESFERSQLMNYRRISELEKQTMSQQTEIGRLMVANTELQIQLAKATSESEGGELEKIATVGERLLTRWQSKHALDILKAKLMMIADQLNDREKAALQKAWALASEISDESASKLLESSKESGAT